MAKSSNFVLIVPLWNWNWYAHAPRQSRTAVLIVPLWNWNVYTSDVISVNMRLNRTFMELKRRLHRCIALLSSS